MKILTVLFFLPLAVMAQSANTRNFSFELNASVNSSVNFDMNSKSMAGFGFGAIVEFMKLKQFRFSSGLEFNQTTQALDFTYLDGKNGNSIQVNKSKMSFVTLPINLNRYFGSKQTFLFSGGVAVDYMLKGEQTITYDSGIAVRKNADPRVINLAPTLAIGCVFPMNKVRFVIKSDLRLGIFPIYDGGSKGNYGTNHYARFVFGIKF